jgi:methylenetetrahydrofolate--tRNA-(uracil-5-)-methyltransferase
MNYTKLLFRIDINPYLVLFTLCLVKYIYMIGKPDLVVIGGGLAGCEAAWQAAIRGCKVALYEMRPIVMTGAHVSSDLAELVCSNSLGSDLLVKANGLLKHELRKLKSLLISCADDTAVPSGTSLSVDRKRFSELVTHGITECKNIQVIREEVENIPDIPTIIASGPLTSEKLARSIGRLTHQEHLYFFDAISPIVTYDSINMDVAFRASRYNTDEGDYINCPFDKDSYYEFVKEVCDAQRMNIRTMDEPVIQGVKAGKTAFFEGCLPIEVLAKRDSLALAYGPMKPIGLKDPRSGLRPYAVVQLRQDNIAGSLYNMVGFQTNLKYSEQERIFRMIPGLEDAVFERFGHMHRNTYIYSPALLYPTLQYKHREDLFFAGQITGVEGYAGNIASGWLAGINASRIINNLPPVELPPETMGGALCQYIAHAAEKDFQPMKANFGLLISQVEIQPDLVKRERNNRTERNRLLSNHSLEILDEFYELIA